MRLQFSRHVRDLALFNLAIDSKLRGCDLVRIQLTSNDYLFPSCINPEAHLSTRQYAKLVKNWTEDIGLDPVIYGTHSLRWTKATLIYRRTKNLRAVQLLLGHANVESTVRYLGIELDDALVIAEQTEI